VVLIRFYEDKEKKLGQDWMAKADQVSIPASQGSNGLGIGNTVRKED
jgi:hypothetical protein